MLNNTRTYSDIWQNCLDQIKARTSAEEFEKWFQPIVPLEFDGTTLRLRVPNESYVRQIEKNYIPFLKPIISQLYGQQTRLHYAVPRATAPAVPVAADADTTAISRFNAQTNTANIKNPFVIPGVKKLIVDPQLNPNLTFATFIEGECNRLARSAGMSVAVNPGNNPFNPLYIYGDSGLGKTHIVQSIGHEVRQRHPELQVLYVSMNKFQAQFQTAYKNGEIPDFIHFYQMIDVLIIDDIQELTGKTGTQNAFFNIFNHLQLAGKQLILTSDKPPVELKDIEQRLLTCFKWGLSAQLNTPDYDTKLKIIRAKAQKLGAQITDDVVAYLADNISANVREIEGALSSLVANASFLGRKITTSLAKEILKVYVKLYQKEITIDHIIEVVCEYLNLDFARFNSTERTREIAQARQIAMYLAKQHTKAPLTTIGSAIGGRNHATVLHSCKAVTNLIETDKAFRRQVEEIEKGARPINWVHIPSVQTEGRDRQCHDFFVYLESLTLKPMKKPLSIIAATAILAGCSQSTAVKFTLTGRDPAFTDGKYMYIITYAGGPETIIDSARIDNSSFAMKGSWPYPVSAFLYMGRGADGEQISDSDFILETGEIRVEKRNEDEFILTGTPQNEFRNELPQKVAGLRQKAFPRCVRPKPATVYSARSFSRTATPWRYPCWRTNY